jgi:hypothetical protein
MNRPGPQIGPRERLRLAALIRAEYERNPLATIDEVRAATGASTNVVQALRKRLVSEGKLASVHLGRDEFEKARAADPQAEAGHA